MRRRGLGALLTGLVAATTLTGCAKVTGSVPGCDAGPRLATVAQSVPSGSYVPCIRELGEGWTAGNLKTRHGSTTFTLSPHRNGAQAVRVSFEETCDVPGATPIAPRAEGVRTSMQLRSIAPRYAGTIVDVFPGGCVRYAFDFARGPHIALMEDLGNAVGLFSRRELRLELKHLLGVELDS